MNTNIKQLKWRQQIEEMVPDNHRIGTDILLISDANFIRANRYIGNKPYKTDVSMAIIYDNGEAVFKINMREYHIKAPAVLIIMYGQTFELISYSDDLQCRAIVMSDSFTNQLFSNSDNSPINQLYLSILTNPIVCFNDEKNIFSQYYELLLNITRSPHSNYKINTVHHLTLAMFYGYSHIKHSFMSNNATPSRQGEIYSEFLKLLSQNYHISREVTFYANRLCITSKHLSRVIKDVSGKSASNVIDEYVTTECKALLTSTTLTIQQISDMLNFSTQSIFGKYFKRIVGVSPKEYRKLINQ